MYRESSRVMHDDVIPLCGTASHTEIEADESGKHNNYHDHFLELDEEVNQERILLPN